MSLLTEQRLRAAAQRETSRLYKSANTILNESARTTRTDFDVFLSHCVRDAELVLGAVAVLESFGYTVYVDWIVDPSLTRDSVSAETARKLRTRMQQCRSLMYLHTLNSPTSKWMPWELGYFDGHAGRVAILPVARSETETFHGQEYLGIYPYVDVARLQGTTREVPWLRQPAGGHAILNSWVAPTRAAS
jgi:hypothetical protein